MPSPSRAPSSREGRTAGGGRRMQQLAHSVLTIHVERQIALPIHELNVTRAPGRDAPPAKFAARDALTRHG
jgi:hypothetical protein